MEFSGLTNKPCGRWTGSRKSIWSGLKQGRICPNVKFPNILLLQCCLMLLTSWLTKRHFLAIACEITHMAFGLQLISTYINGVLVTPKLASQKVLTPYPYWQRFAKTAWYSIPILAAKIGLGEGFLQPKLVPIPKMYCQTCSSQFPTICFIAFMFSCKGSPCMHAKLQ